MFGRKLKLLFMTIIGFGLGFFLFSILIEKMFEPATSVFPRSNSTKDLALVLDKSVEQVDDLLEKVQLSSRTTISDTAGEQKTLQEEIIPALSDSKKNASSQLSSDEVKMEGQADVKSIAPEQNLKDSAELGTKATTSFGAKKDSTSGNSFIPKVEPLAPVQATQGSHVSGKTAVRGKFSEKSEKINTARIYGTQKHRDPSQQRYTSSMSIPTGEDSTVHLTLIDDVAKTLINGYWPQGTHPFAAKSDYTSVSLRFLNNRFVNKLVAQEAFSISKNREQVLQYILVPSMIEGLYGLYSERTIRYLNKFSKQRVVSKDGQEYTLSTKDQKKMYALYAQHLRSLSSAMQAYYMSTIIPDYIERYLNYEIDALKAGDAFFEARRVFTEQGKVFSITILKEYHDKVEKREHAKKLVIDTMRQVGKIQSLDDDSLLYLALWLHRRDVSQKDGLAALMYALIRFADRLDEERTELGFYDI